MPKIAPTSTALNAGSTTGFNLKDLRTGHHNSETGGSTSASGGDGGTSGPTSGVHKITNGICTFSPTSTKGKWIFLIQTIILSFAPIIVLIAQNGHSFYSLMKEKEEIVHKSNLVIDAMGLSNFIMALQWERAAVSLAVFLDAKSGKTTDLSKQYGNTDRSLREVQWRRFGPEKVFENPLRFQIRIDDFRKKVTNINQNINNSAMSHGDDSMSDQEILDFYNLATSRLLTGLEKDLGDAQSSFNWKITMTYFNMIQCLESAGIGLVYGLRFYSIGKLDEHDVVHYVRTHAKMYEYYRQAQEIVPPNIGRVLHKLFTSEAYQIVNSSTVQILENVQIEADDKKGRRYFEGSVKFMKTLNQILDMLVLSVQEVAADKLHECFIAQVWGGATLCLVLIICPLLTVLSKNAIASIQVFALSVEKKSNDMRKQKKKQEKLIYKMLPKVIVERIVAGEKATTAETFEQTTLYFCTIDGFGLVAKHCGPVQLINFVNKVYITMERRMDNHDVYRVETVSDQSLVVSGAPKKNGDKHASEICNMALDMKAACGSIVRPDIAPRTITIRAGVHTGNIVAGVVGGKMPRYVIFGDSINTASKMETSGEADKIQISKTTWLLLSMKGGFILEENTLVEVKGKGLMQTYWLLDSDRKEGGKKDQKGNE